MEFDFGKKPETNAVVRAESETSIKVRPDRVGRYFKKYMSKFVFDELSLSYLEKAKLTDIMQGVPIPLRKKDLASFKGGEGITAQEIAENMVWVIGADPHFAYTQNYVEYLIRVFTDRIAENILKKGRDAAERDELNEACVFFRASLCIKPSFLDAMYSYARVCRDLYDKSGNKEYVGRFKAESMDYFELTTEMHPKFAQAYYYLGYAYLNMGLHVKAQLAWQIFVRKTANSKDRKEISERLRQIQEPVEIELGVNEVLAGRFQEGLMRLEPYMDTRFKDWWPLSYYLGVCYIRTGQQKDAVTSFKRALTMNGSHLETMEELAAIYAKDKDKENETKYRNKIKLIRGQLKEKEDEEIDEKD